MGASCSQRLQPCAGNFQGTRSAFLIISGKAEFGNRRAKRIPAHKVRVILDRDHPLRIGRARCNHTLLPAEQGFESNSAGYAGESADVPRDRPDIFLLVRGVSRVFAERFQRAERGEAGGSGESGEFDKLPSNHGRLS